MKYRAQMTKKTSVIAVANHKGGCGKTTTVVNLSAELAKNGAFRAGDRS